MSKVKENIQRLFEKYRVIIWYDGDQHFTDQFAELDLGAVIKHTIQNDEFAIKYNMLLLHPESKFLVYAS